MTNPSCPSCHSPNVHSKGSFNTQAGKKKRFKCTNCGCGWSLMDNETIPLDDFLQEIDEEQDYTQKESHEIIRYVITSCQSNAQTNQEFFESLKTYCEHNNAVLLIIPVKYRIQGRIPLHDDADDHEFDPELYDYFLEDNVKLHSKLKVLGKLKINATAANPLAGLDAICKGSSIIVGHNQLQLKTLPVAQIDYPVIMTTTGTVSYPEYSDGKAGYKAEFNHSYSAIVVELEDELFHIRQLEFDGNGFFDLDTYYSTDSVYKVTDPVYALIPGDEHAIFNDPDVKAATYTNDDSIAKVLNPQIIVRHDLLDSYAVCHFHKKNTFINYAKWQSGRNSIQDELDATIKFVVETTPPESKNAIIASNHNDHLTRWLNECNPNLEPWNALIYHQLMYKMLLHTKDSPNGAEYPNPFRLYSEPQFDYHNTVVDFIGRNESYMIMDIECAFHGDVGNNGSRGTRAQFSNLPRKSVIGHSHSPGIEKGCYQVGTSSYLQLEYNKGPSSWLNTHCLIYANGKRTLINVIEGKWRA